MSSLTIVAIHEIMAEHEDNYTKLCSMMVEKTRQEEGCLYYQFYKDNSRVSTYVFIEEWASQTALDQHGMSEHMSVFKHFLNDKLKNRTVHRLSPLPKG